MADMIPYRRTDGPLKLLAERGSSGRLAEKISQRVPVPQSHPLRWRHLREVDVNVQEARMIPGGWHPASGECDSTFAARRLNDRDGPIVLKNSA
jgi:hypothetical protein